MYMNHTYYWMIRENSFWFEAITKIKCWNKTIKQIFSEHGMYTPVSICPEDDYGVEFQLTNLIEDEPLM